MLVSAVQQCESTVCIHISPEKAMVPHSSTLAWKIPWTEEPGGLQSMGSWRVGHDWATSLSRFTFMHWRRQWQPTPVFLPGESQGWGRLMGCRLWGRTELDTTEATQQHQQQWLGGKESTCSAGATGDAGFIPGSGRSLEEDVATHSSILACRILWTEEPGGLQSVGFQRVGHNWIDLARMHTWRGHGVSVNWNLNLSS